MSKLFLVFIFCLTQLNASSLSEIINIALKQNHSLESINHRISANSSMIEASNKFANPTLSFNTNTLDDKEKMNKQTISVQQKLYFYGKRDSKQGIVLAKYEVLNENLLQAKVNLVKAIKNQAYSIWELEELYKTILYYEDLTRQNIALSESYTVTSGNQHMGIMSAELSLSNLRIQKSTLNAKIKIAYSKLSALASIQIDKLDLNLKIDEMADVKELQIGLLNNNSILVKDKEIKKNKAILDLAEINNYPDVNLLASYSFRKNFDNYSTFGVAVSLPIYGVESSKEENARAMVLSAQSLKEDSKIVVNSEFQNAYAQMKSQYEIYNIIHNESMLQTEHMFELIDSSISTGGDLYRYVDILIQKLKLEQKSINAIANYNKAMAKISALSGEMK